MSMRDQIAHIIINDHDQHISAASTADAILAALPDMIAPLVWEEDGWWRHSAKPFSKTLPRVAFWIMNVDKGWRFASTGDVFETLEAAKAAANTHHRAAIMAALKPKP
jgi:hypothetical protein